ncbi:MAG: hypothetical protein GY929_18645 [Actinomycetia bacterium]|nr:hypothetical protein [Actinomycetes bacterium]
METRRWTNQNHPQTLQMSVLLLYMSAATGFLFGNVYSRQFGLAIGLLAAIGLAAAAFGIANDKKWGYSLGVVLTGLALVPFLLLLIFDGPGELLDLQLLFIMVFPVARFALLVHPMSRDHQRIWFS